MLLQKRKRYNGYTRAFGEPLFELDVHEWHCWEGWVDNLVQNIYSDLINVTRKNCNNNTAFPFPWKASVERQAGVHSQKANECNILLRNIIATHLPMYRLFHQRDRGYIRLYILAHASFGLAHTSLWPLPALISVAGAETITLISQQLVLAPCCMHLCAQH